MTSIENVPPLETNESSPAAAAQDNTTIAATTEPQAEISALSSSDAAAPASVATTQQQPSQSETQNEAREKKDAVEEDNEGKPSPSQVAPAPEPMTAIATATTTTPEDTLNAVAAEPSSDLTTSEDTTAPDVEDGEASEQPQAVKEGEEEGPGLVITLLLTTGARHPFKIDKKYLRRRSVKVDDEDPFKMSVYTLKELIWREWRSEWDPQPSSPSLIRLIYFGKLLDDKSPLSDSNLAHDAPNVIHMTVKPQEAVEEEDAKGGKSYAGRDRESTDRSPGCRCIIL